MKIIVALGLLTLLTGCTASPYDMPMPIVTADGSRGYSMTGYVQFTHDEEAARKEIKEVLDARCGSPAEFLSLLFTRADSIVGVNHLHYDAVVRCT